LGSAVATAARAGPFGALAEDAGEGEVATAVMTCALRAGAAGAALAAGVTSTALESLEALAEEACESVVEADVGLGGTTAGSRGGGASRRADATTALFVGRAFDASTDDTARDAGASGRSASQPRNASAITIPVGTRQSKPPDGSGVVDVSSFDGPGTGSAGRGIVRLGSRAP